MVYELEWVFQVCDGFYCSTLVTYDGAVLFGSGSTNKLFCRCFLVWQEANEVILLVVILPTIYTYICMVGWQYIYIYIISRRSITPQYIKYNSRPLDVVECQCRMSEEICLCQENTNNYGCIYVCMLMSMFNTYFIIMCLLIVQTYFIVILVLQCQILEIYFILYQFEILKR